MTCSGTASVEPCVILPMSFRKRSSRAFISGGRGPGLRLLDALDAVQYHRLPPDTVARHAADLKNAALLQVDLVAPLEGVALRQRVPALVVMPVIPHEALAQFGVTLQLTQQLRDHRERLKVLPRPLQNLQHPLQWKQ
jgi:hypothetical protein